MAHNYAKHGIRVNAISTAATDSYQLRHEAELAVADDPDRDVDDVLREMGDSIPIGRLGRPKDLADAVLFLVSDKADYVVGSILRVSGGGNLK